MLQSMVIHHKRVFFTRRIQLSVVILIPLCHNNMALLTLCASAETEFVDIVFDYKHTAKFLCDHFYQKNKTNFVFIQRLLNHLRKRIFLATEYNFSTDDFELLKTQLVTNVSSNYYR
ncbi:unnamed protein product [Rotaria magnacalcarata]